MSFLLIFCLSFSGCASSRNAAPEAPVLEASVSEEVEVGQRIHDEILSTFRPYTEPVALGYLDSIVKDLASHAERKELSYRSTVLYSDQVYATSAPGGHIYLTTGMIFFLENEAELAAVLAHEIGELQYRHAKFSKTNQWLDSMVNGGSMVAPAFGQFGALAALGLIAVKAVHDGKQLTLEERLIKADERALEYMVKAGYDPQGLMDVFYKFLNAKREIIPYFSDYYEARPLSEERVLRAQEVFKTLPLANQSFTAHRAQFLEMTQGVREIYRQ